MRDEAVTRCTTGGRCARCELVDLKCLLRNKHKRAMFMTVFGNSTCHPNIAFSHTHGDHVGNANYFTKATLYMQEPEYAAAFGANPSKFGFDPSTYEKLRANPVIKRRLRRLRRRVGDDPVHARPHAGPPVAAGAAAEARPRGAVGGRDALPGELGEPARPGQ